MRLILVPIVFLICMTTAACSENYSNGERIGMVTQFSKKGVIWKTREGQLNITQTGMNSSSTTPFDFSIDNDNEDLKVVALIDSAVNLGWKVKLIYHETIGKNWFSNRGNTDHFITGVEIIDRTPMNFMRGGSATANTANAVVGGKVIDTVYVVIVGSASSNFKLVPAK
jgi:hypothetical protein